MSDNRLIYFHGPPRGWLRPGQAPHVERPADVAVVVGPELGEGVRDLHLIPRVRPLLARVEPEVE